VDCGRILAAEAVKRGRPVDEVAVRSHIVVSNVWSGSMASDTVVRARIDGQVKEKAAKVLADMGLSVSDAIRLLLIRVAAERTLPFEIKVPNGRLALRWQSSSGGRARHSRAWPT
jgi:DNA-damage-inducible protein J